MVIQQLLTPPKQLVAYHFIDLHLQLLLLPKQQKLLPKQQAAYHFFVMHLRLLIVDLFYF
jgi:hypothetical protein